MVKVTWISCGRISDFLERTVAVKVPLLRRESI